MHICIYTYTYVGNANIYIYGIHHAVFGTWGCTAQALGPPAVLVLAFVAILRQR